MCKFVGKSNERILCKLNKSEILRLYSIVHVAMETTKTSNFTCQSKSFIGMFFTRQVSACELQLFSCYDLPNDIHSQTAKTVFSHLNIPINVTDIVPVYVKKRINRLLKHFTEVQILTSIDLTMSISECFTPAW